MCKFYKESFLEEKKKSVIKVLNILKKKFEWREKRWVKKERMRKVRRIMFHKNADFFFLPSKNIWFLRNRSGGFIFNNFSNSYYRKSVDLLEVYFFTKYACNSFIAHMLAIYNRLFFLFFLKLKVRGLGYRIKKITSNLFRFFIGTTNYYYLHLPFSLYIKLVEEEW